MTGPTLLGTLTGISIHRYYLRLLPILTLTPVAMPEILLGVSLLLFFNLVFRPWPGLELGLGSIPAYPVHCQNPQPCST